MTNKFVLGANTGQKRIFVDLSAQHVYAAQGEQIVYVFLTSSGKWHLTPTGHFQIWGKFRYVHMTGGNPAIGTAYDLPNVPFVMFFAGENVSREDGYSFHGTYWHNNFGHPMSHGCLNLRTEDAQALYDWADPSTLGTMTLADATSPGTQVYIYGTTPQE
jgi:lipoprotein-anchoring transpeptidase ErfK/SrfK